MPLESWRRRRCLSIGWADKTKCNFFGVRAQASPLENNHSVDSDLASICSSYGCVQIVTRSSRKEEIEQFLSERGVPVRKVHSIKRLGAKNKAEIISKELAEMSADDSGVGLFVDDDIKELTD